VNDQILRFIVACRLPFNTISHPQFQCLLKMVSSGAKISTPSRHQLKDRLIELGNDTKSQIAASFPAKGKISIALDCWTSQNQQSFLAITGYFITDDFKYSEVLLSFSSLEGSHDGSNLASMVLSVLEEYNLSQRVLAVTTDNASNNGTMMTELTNYLYSQLEQTPQFTSGLLDPLLQSIIYSQHHIPCLAHVLQLSVQALLFHLKVDAQNDVPLMQWDPSQSTITSHSGLPRSLEKVRIISNSS
jgi:hypothetical protein